MELPVITGFYAGLLAILWIILSARVSIMRAKVSVSVLDGGDHDLAVKMRQHGNLAENAAFALLLIALLDMGPAPSWAIHALGIVLVVARLAHPFGIKWDSDTELMRAIGTGGTLLVLLVSGLWLIYLFGVRVL